MFLDDAEGSSDTPIERTELPTGVVTILAKCYSPGCDIGMPGSCYAYDCPRKVSQLLTPNLNGMKRYFIDWIITTPKTC